MSHENLTSNNNVDGGAKGLHALLWLCQESGETHLQDGRYVKGYYI